MFVGGTLFKLVAAGAHRPTPSELFEPATAWTYFMPWLFMGRHVGFKIEQGESFATGVERTAAV